MCGSTVSRREMSPSPPPRAPQRFFCGVQMAGGLSRSTPPLLSGSVMHSHWCLHKAQSSSLPSKNFHPKSKSPRRKLQQTKSRNGSRSIKQRIDDDRRKAPNLGRAYCRRPDANDSAGLCLRANGCHFPASKHIPRYHNVKRLHYRWNLLSQPTQKHLTAREKKQRVCGL